MYLTELLEVEQQKALHKDIVMKLSYRPNLKYLYYDDLKPSDTLKTLLPQKNSGVLILFVMHGTKSQVGHFCLLFRNEKSGLHFFDSYGMGLRKVIQVTHSAKRLEKLISGHDIHINKHRFQVMEKGQRAVNTCGRHCITRYNAAQLKPKEYENLMYHPSLDPDEIVTLMTMEMDLTQI